MKHLGDITKLNGGEIPPVDCITGGSAYFGRKSTARARRFGQAK